MLCIHMYSVCVCVCVLVQLTLFDEPHDHSVPAFQLPPVLVLLGRGGNVVSTFHSVSV